MDARYHVRAWKTQTGTVEAAIVDNRGRTDPARFVSKDDLLDTIDQCQTATERGTFIRPGYWLSLDSTIEDNLLGGEGASIYFIHDASRESINYLAFRGHDRDTMWNDTSDPRSTFTYKLGNDELIPLTTVGFVSSTFEPTAAVDHEVRL